MSARRRLDLELVRRGLVTSRESAQDAVAAGRVTVNGAPADKPARQVSTDDALVVTAPARTWVSRGGEKLDAALARFDIPIDGRRCLDAGASTGGFTDVLLARGAASVLAVDVGRGQLHDRLRRDARVDVMDRTNIRTAVLAGAPFDVVVADLSFISLRTVAPMLAVAMAGPGADLVWLVKPQFEAGRQAVAAGRGVVRDPAAWRQAVFEVGCALQANGAAIMGAMPSPLRGADGNVEFLVWARAHTGGGADPSAVADAAVAEVGAG